MVKDDFRAWNNEIYNSISQTPLYVMPLDSNPNLVIVLYETDSLRQGYVTIIDTQLGQLKIQSDFLVAAQGDSICCYSLKLYQNNQFVIVLTLS